MKYDQDMHKEIEAIMGLMLALHDKLKNFHTNYCCLNRHSAGFCDTTNLDLFADDLDGIKADEVGLILEQVRDAFDREHTEIDTTEADESAMLRFYQAGIR